MKYFNSLPKTQFNSSIGLFDICDFFVYIDNSAIPFKTSQITVDSRTTLLEAAYKAYQDTNSFWAFLLANKYINPFTLLSTNVNIFLTENQNKINMQLSGNTSGTTAYVFPKGSIVLPYTSNTGGSYSYSSVGNFDLNGPLGLIESVSYYNNQIVLKDQVGATYTFIQPYGSTSQQLTVIYSTDGGTYEIQTLLYPYDTKPATQTVVKNQTMTAEIVDDLFPAGLLVGDVDESATHSMTQITATTAVETSSKTINAYSPIDLSTVKTYLVSAKYNSYG